MTLPKGVECWRKFSINSYASSSWQTNSFFFLLSHELRGERYKKKWLRNNFHGFKMPPFRDPTLNYGLWALKKKEERRFMRPFFDVSKRLSYFYIPTMNIFVDFREHRWCCFYTLVLDKQGSLSGKNVKFYGLFRELQKRKLK